MKILVSILLCFFANQVFSKDLCNVSAPAENTWLLLKDKSSKYIMTDYSLGNGEVVFCLKEKIGSEQSVVKKITANISNKHFIASALCSDGGMPAPEIFAEVSYNADALQVHRAWRFELKTKDIVSIPVKNIDCVFESK